MLAYTTRINVRKHARVNQSIDCGIGHAIAMDS